MAEQKKGTWPDLSAQGLKMSLHIDEDGTRRVIISALKGDIPADVNERLDDIGFTKMVLDGNVVHTKSGKLISTDLQRALRYGTATLPANANFRITGKLEAYEEPAVQDDLEGADLSAFAEVDIDAEDTPDEPAPQKAEAEKAAPKPAAPKKETSSLDKPKKARGQAPAKPVDPSELEALPGWDAFADLDDFDAFLTHEGVPSQARAEFLSAMQVIRATFEFEDIFVKQHTDEKKAFGAKLREMFLKETRRKDLATMRIIDCVYPFAKEFLKRDAEQRAQYRVFAEARAHEVDAVCDWLDEVVEDYHDRAREANGGKEIANFMSTYPRNIRMTGARTFMNFIAAEDQTPLFRQMKENDARFTELVGKQANNYMSPVVTKLRGDETVVENIRERRNALFGEPAPEMAPAP